MSDASSNNAQSAALLATFAGDVSPEQRREALTGLIAAKFLPKEAAHPAVIAGRDRLLHDACHHPDDRLRLVAIAESIRLSQVVKRWLPVITKALEPAFVDELPALSLLQEADDRLNVARACALFERAWLPDYLACSIADEEQGEKARTELIGALLPRSQTLTDALTGLAQAFGRVKPSTESPGDSLAKRLTRTLSCLRAVLVESDLEAGADPGPALMSLITGPLNATGKPQDDKAKIELTREVLLTVHDIVRTRLSVVAEPTMYQVVGYCRRFFSGSGWPDDLAKPLERLVTDVTEALLLLGRQGKRNQPLREQLDVLCKYPERARALAKNLAARHPELDEEVRVWLETGRARLERDLRTTAVEVEAGSADAAIGLALEAARLARHAGEGMRERLLSSLEIFEPSLVSPTQGLLERIKQAAVQVEQVASLRNVQLFGTPGEEVEASPKYFDVASDSPRARMVVRQPAVVRIRGDGAVGDVLLKGIVE
ncbi:hypothetical protein LGM80_11610 [Burkholderia multivorans]|jgi:hypothetical protein|uniref:hypothetical protein n=1 Tax=Burkholderia multivorans TaxID=87883 RepID=UPI0009E0D02C|nr:hypothetical protein [Burkholderia multivorans]MCA8374013.1 hypothetical protein [Burkholderia multivorans]SAK14070.1 hypothetical protein UA17_00798 [Burkholderia multivorans]